MTPKVLIALISVAMTLTGYYFYLRDILRGKTKPHAFSWLVWAVLTGIAFAGQLHDHGGPGAWVTLVTAVMSILFFVLALQRGEKDITLSDKLNLVGAAAALVLWFVTSDPVFSVILICVVDFLGFMPTIRKSYRKPYEETLIAYLLAGLKFVLAIIALDHYTLTTWLYPATLVAANGFFVVMLTVRRKQLPLTPLSL